MHFVLLVELDLTLRQWRTLVLFKHHLQRILLVLFFTAAVLLNAFIANSEQRTRRSNRIYSFIGTFLVIGNAGKWTLSRKRDRNRASRSSRMLMGFHSEWSQRPTHISSPSKDLRTKHLTTMSVTTVQ